MPNSKRVVLFLLAFGCQSLAAQYHCDEAAAKTIPWQMRPETRTSERARYLQPFFTEMQRLFPQPPPGLQVTYGIFDAKGGVQRFSTGTDFYEAFLMIKDIVCEKQSNGQRRIVPEGETGCWLYVRPNDFRHLMQAFMSSTELYLPNTGLPLFSGDIRMAENERGMMSVYVFNESEEQTFAGWFFSARKTLPIRKVSKKELAIAFRTQQIKYWEGRNQSLQKTLAASKEGYKRAQADNNYPNPGEKEKLLQSYIEGDKKIVEAIEENKTRMDNCRQNTDAMMRAADAESAAYESDMKDLMFGQNRKADKNSRSRFVYAEDETYFSKSLPKAQPQFAVAYLRRQDITPAKTAFIKKIEDVFDWNVVRKMVGAAPAPQPLTISEVGSTPGGYTSGALPQDKVPAAAGGVYFTEDFSSSTAGKQPAKWTVVQSSAVVKEINGKNCLAVKKEGLFFPDYAVLQLPQNFTLSFDLSWNPDISYYSPNFMVHIGAARYDNTLKRYDREQVNDNAYTAARMERICLWIDPHWNDIGHCGLEEFDKNGGYLSKKSFTAPQFHKERNAVQVKLVRQGVRLLVYFNGEQVNELPAAMKPEVRWNFIGFGLSNSANAAPEDELWLSNIRLTQ